MTRCNYSGSPWQWKSGLHLGCRPCSTCWCIPCCLCACCPWPSFWPCGCTATANLPTATWTWARWDGGRSLLYSHLCHMWDQLSASCFSSVILFLTLYFRLQKIPISAVLLVDVKEFDVFFLVCLGSRAHSPFPLGGPETPAASGSESQGALWLRLESATDEWICCCEDLPCSGALTRRNPRCSFNLFMMCLWKALDFLNNLIK